MRIIISLLIILYSTPSYADLGGCVVYHVKYALKDGTTQTGYLPLYGYDDFGYLDADTKTNKYCDDKAFQTLINHLFYTQRKTLRFEIYTKIHLVDFGRSAKQTGPSPPICAFADSSSVVQLNLDSIKYTIFLSARPAEWNYPEVWIQLVDSKTSLMMQQNSVINHTWLTRSPVIEKPGAPYLYDFENYFVLNYNQNISLEELKNELNDISEKIYASETNWVKSGYKASEKTLEQEKRNTQIPLINRLRQKGIIVIKVQSTC